jgi:uncharacterized protein YndB with AHSA1/START domain
MIDVDNKLIVSTPSDREILMTRVFDAPRDLVFQAMTDPKAIPQWWGPRRYETIVDKMEPRAGGAWRFINRDREGNEFAFHGVYREVSAPERLAYTFEFEGFPGQVSLETITLEEREGKTYSTNRILFDSVEARDGMVDSGMESGASETMDRLAELVQRMRREQTAQGAQR